MTPTQLIADSYERYHLSVYRFFCRRIEDQEDAKDLSQDVFLRLMNYSKLLLPETIKSFIFTIAHNLLTDYLRRHYHKIDFLSYIYDMAPRATEEVESRVVAADLLSLEHRRVQALPPQRKTVYLMSRFEEKSVADIAATLHLSYRTVENHLFAGRKAVRAYMRQCI